MPHHLTALVAIEITSIRQNMLSRLRNKLVETIELREDDDLLTVIKREAPDVLIVHWRGPNNPIKSWVEHPTTIPSLRLLPVLAVLDQPVSSVDCEKMRDAEISDFVPVGITDNELIWRLHTLSRQGHDRRLFAQREPFEEFTTHAPDGIIIADASSKILYTNPAARALFDSSVAFTGSVFDLFSEASQPLLNDYLALSQTKIAEPLRVKMAHPRSPFYEAEITTRNLSESRRIFSIRLFNTSNELDDNTIVAQRLDILGQLTGGIAHDLNNVINAVVGGTTLLEMDADKSLRPQIQSILKTAKRGGELLHQLLLFSRGSEVTQEPTNLCEITRECAAIAADTFPRNIEIRYRGPPNNDYPSIRANSAQIHQIVMNLCVNARDGMPNGGELTIATARCFLTPEAVSAIDGAKIGGNYQTVEVCDSGTGIPPEIRARIFEPFFTTKPKGKGTGLGLPTVMRLMQLHGGFVTVESTSERGTTVKCYFPSESNT